jgi:hypothetical protein
VRTVDDDHILPAGHLARIAECINRDPAAIWTTGEVSYLNGLLYGGSPTALQLGPAGVGCAVSSLADNWAIADGSTVYPREVFDRGLLMEESGYGSSYLEYGAYLYSRGYISKCANEECVIHNVDRATIERPLTLESRAFAAIVYNCFFRPKSSNIARFMVPLILRGIAQKSVVHLVKCYRRARLRWRVATPCS